MVDFGLTGDLLETVGSVNNVSVSKPGKNQVEPPQGSFGFKGQSCGLMLCGLITLSLLFTQ